MTPDRRRAVRSPASEPLWSMSTSPHLSNKLRDTLGPEAGDELIGIVDKAAGDISDLRGDLAELRHQTALGFARVDAQFAVVGERLEKQTNRLILWSFAFWATTMAAIASLR